MADNRASTFFQASSHVLVVGAGLIYVFGFIIVSIHDATYGIADFSLFRTKVIAVGTLFAILVALGMLLAFRMFALFGFTTAHASQVGVTVTNENKLFAIAFVAMSIPFACFAVSFSLIFLFTNFPESKLPGMAWVFLTITISASLGIVSRKWLDAHPFTLLVLSSLNAIAFFVLLFRYAYVDRTFFWFTLWLSSICIFTLYVFLWLRKTEEMRRVEWERILGLVVGVVFFVYAGKVYPHIKHQFGGGAPVPIILHMSKKLPAFDSENATVSLIDETEQGYYVLTSADRAVFVTRGLVEEVEFLRTK